MNYEDLIFQLPLQIKKNKKIRKIRADLIDLLTDKTYY